jgi:DNA ligase-1
VGTGFSDKERESPPPVGSTITFRYQELSDAGVPRFPSYVGVRHDGTASPEKGEGSMTTATTGSRRFEFVEGTSRKFWEVETHGHEVVVRFGRIGSAGQTNTKTFADGGAAATHAAKLVGEKVKKGYVEKV